MRIADQYVDWNDKERLLEDYIPLFQLSLDLDMLVPYLVTLSFLIANR